MNDQYPIWVHITVILVDIYIIYRVFIGVKQLKNRVFKYWKGRKNEDNQRHAKNDRPE